MGKSVKKTITKSGEKYVVESMLEFEGSCNSG